MRAVQDPPRFAQFFPSLTFRCDACAIGLTYGDEARDESPTNDLDAQIT
jgi:hypothetical protein